MCFSNLLSGQERNWKSRNNHINASVVLGPCVVPQRSALVGQELLLCKSWLFEAKYGMLNKMEKYYKIFYECLTSQIVKILPDNSSIPKTCKKNVGK